METIRKYPLYYFFISDRIDLLLMQSGVIKLGECWFILSDQILSLNIIKTFLCLEKVEQWTWVCPGLIQWQVSLSQFVTLTWAQVTWWPHAISRILTVKKKDSNSQYKKGSLLFLFIKLSLHLHSLNPNLLSVQRFRVKIQPQI